MGNGIVQSGLNVLLFNINNNKIKPIRNVNNKNFLLKYFFQSLINKNKETIINIEFNLILKGNRKLTISPIKDKIINEYNICAEKFCKLILSSLYINAP